MLESGTALPVSVLMEMDMIGYLFFGIVPVSPWIVIPQYLFRIVVELLQSETQQLVVINLSRRLNSPFPAEVDAMLDHRTPRNNDALHDEVHNAVRGASRPIDPSCRFNLWRTPHKLSLVFLIQLGPRVSMGWKNTL